MTKQFEFELCKFELLTSVFNKTEYYMGFKIVLNLILILNLNFFYLNIEHLKFNTIVFFQGRVL